jgi:hypothetical protein
VPVKLKPRQRLEGEIVPQGISITDMQCRWHIYIRRGDEIAMIKLPKWCWTQHEGAGGMYYLVLNKNDYKS